MEQKLIKEGELFCLGDRLFTYSINESGGIVIKPETETYKPARSVKAIFSPPTLDEVKAYFKEKGYIESAAIKAWNYYDAGNWHDSKGTPVKNWKQKMMANWMKDESKIKDGKPEPTKVNNFYQND